jgi:hypothetical protein
MILWNEIKNLLISINILTRALKSQIKIIRTWRLSVLAVKKYFNNFLKQNLIILLSVFINSCNGNKSISKLNGENKIDTIFTNFNGNGIQFEIDFIKGKAHNHPTFAIWIEDLEGNFIQTLFVTKSIASGIFSYGDAGNGSWKNTAGESVRPAALPYWSHKNTISNLDAWSGATPKSNFVIKSKLDKQIQKKFRILMEINQTWDWNEFWTNNKFSGDMNYQSSCQPSLVYAVTIDTDQKDWEYYMNPVGHGHYSGADGKLYTNLSTFTTALHIAKSVRVIIK